LEEEFGHQRFKVLKGIKGRRTKKIECDQALLQLTKMLSSVHTMLLSTTFLAKPMFKINKPLFI
jgi:hypothetical protein